MLLNKEKTVEENFMILSLENLMWAYAQIFKLYVDKLLCTF